MWWRFCAEIGDLRRCVAAHNLELKFSPVPALSPPQYVEKLDESVSKKTVRQFLALVLSKFSDDKLHKIFADTQVHKGDSKVTSRSFPHICALMLSIMTTIVSFRAQKAIVASMHAYLHTKSCAADACGSVLPALLALLRVPSHVIAFVCIYVTADTCTAVK